MEEKETRKGPIHLSYAKRIRKKKKGGKTETNRDAQRRRRSTHTRKQVRPWETGQYYKGQRERLHFFFSLSPSLLPPFPHRFLIPLASHKWSTQIETLRKHRKYATANKRKKKKFKRCPYIKRQSSCFPKHAPTQGGGKEGRKNAKGSLRSRQVSFKRERQGKTRNSKRDGSKLFDDKVSFSLFFSFEDTCSVVYSFALPSFFVFQVPHSFRHPKKKRRSRSSHTNQHHKLNTLTLVELHVKKKKARKGAGMERGI
jgi:hypothetical protein